MRYAISYVSSANRELSEAEIQKILSSSETRNNERHITGLLLYSDGNFFQVIEGEKEEVLNLYPKIRTDKRHHTLIKIFEKEIHKESFNDYDCNFISEEGHYNDERLDLYLNRVKTLDEQTQKTVRTILEAIIR